MQAVVPTPLSAGLRPPRGTAWVSSVLLSLGHSRQTKAWATKAGLGLPREGPWLPAPPWGPQTIVPILPSSPLCQCLPCHR